MISKNAKQDIHVIELRNYILKPGKRDPFMDYFEENFTQSQIDLGGYPLGQFRIKGSENNFFWIRGFADMASRSKFLPSFYYGPVWKEYKGVANNMLVNNDNVYLLKPLTWVNGSLQQDGSINSDELKTGKGIAVVDFYIANSKLDKLISFFSKTYPPFLKNDAVQNDTFWISELAENDFPRLPVFQDKNLLVVIGFYKDEIEYGEKQHQMQLTLSEDLKAEWLDIVTFKNSLVLYPTEKTFSHLTG
jgi:hypothetical protein